MTGRDDLPPVAAYAADATLMPADAPEGADESIAEPADGYGAGPRPFGPLDAEAGGEPVGEDVSDGVAASAEAEWSATPPLPTLDEWADKKVGAATGRENPRRERKRGGTETPDDAPVIKIRAGELPRAATATERALIAAGAPFYARGGELVRPCVDEVEAAHGRSTLVARLAPATADMLLDHASRVAVFERFDARSNRDVRTDPPRSLALTILSRDGEWTFAPLAGVVTTPTMRPDGTILSAPGYDRATRLLVIDPPTMPSIPDVPTKADAEAALATIMGLLAEFPFASTAAKSVAISGLLSTVARGALGAVPMHVISASTPGTGKSYFADVVAAVSTGQRAPVIAVGRTEEETEKRLVSAVLAGQPIICVDNVNGDLGGDFLCQLVERPLVQVRPLGASKVVRLENRVTTLVTGNNVRVIGDMTRRALVCRLDSDLERPELRQFSRRPFDDVLADRGRYIAAALTIVRGYHVAGRPGLLPSLASFEAWSDCIRSALVWLGLEDPCLTMEIARADDPVTAGLRSVLATWCEAAGETGYLVGEIKAKADAVGPHGQYLHSELRDALLAVAEARNGGIEPRRLGIFLTRHEGRPLDGMKLVSTVDGHSKQKRWAVMRVVRGFAGSAPIPVRELSGDSCDIGVGRTPATYRTSRRPLFDDDFDDEAGA